MSTSSRLADALLGSPIPPPRWLDPRYRSTGWVSPGSAYPSLYYFYLPTHVPAGYIRAELDELTTCVNPPLVQGWAWILALAGAAVMFLGLIGMRQRGTDDGLAIAMVLVAIPAWFAAVVLGGFWSHDVELRDGSVYVRRWTDVWFGRTGRSVGHRASVHAVLSCGRHIHLAGDAGVGVVSMAMWPSSSRRALEERFEHWGVELEFPGSHHAHHPQHWSHGHHRFDHELPEQGRHRRLDGPMGQSGLQS